jgi:nucleoside-diphosphate-sugar epimerase
MKAIVTGGLGFIGSTLVDMLLKVGYEIIIVDSKLNNVVDEKEYSKNCKVAICPVWQYHFIEDVDIVFHLASFVGPSGVLPYAGHIAPTIINDVVHIRNYCAKTGAMFVDISTSEVYGHTGVLTEDSVKVYPGKYEVRTEYGASKMAAEISLVNYVKVYKDFDYHIIRPFNVTGPRQSPNGGFVLPRFVIAALTDQPITVFGDGKQERAFTDVRDICEAILAIVDSEHANEIWNIGNIKNRMTIEELAQIVVNRVKAKYPEMFSSEIIYIDPKLIHGALFSEAIDKVPYTMKIEELVGWRARYPLSETIDDLIEYYVQKINQGYSFRVLP